MNSFDDDFSDEIQVVNLRGAVIVFGRELLFARMGFMCFPSKVLIREAVFTHLGGDHFI